MITNKDKSAPNANGISQREATQAVKTLLQYVGENTQRDGLLDTPDRFCRALLEMTCGYWQDPKQILSTTFESDNDDMVLLRDIEFSSLCEHHLLSFSGKAHIAYLPQKGRIVGLSKLARIVDVFAKRLQVQERLTQEIANAIDQALNPKGVAVVLEGVHSCMCVRGIQKQNASMTTQHMLGLFKDSSGARSEFFNHIYARR